MKLPNRERAIVPKNKLDKYLLSETHSVGKAKAKFLRGFGFDESNLELLELGLIHIAQGNEVANIAETDRGTKYLIDGRMTTPIGEEIILRTVWIIERGEDYPRFVTAYPA